MYRYRLVDADTQADLGPFISARLNFAVGEVLARTPWERFNIVDVITCQDDEDPLRPEIV